MCSRVTCHSCGKPTWSGCGAHVEMVLGNVPPQERCACRQKQGGGRQQHRSMFGNFWGGGSKGK